MKAKKENKVYTIATEQEKSRYLKEGYDIYDDSGNLLEHSPLKKIAYSEYAKILEENIKLKAENAELIVKLGEVKETPESKTGKK